MIQVGTVVFMVLLVLLVAVHNYRYGHGTITSIPTISISRPNTAQVQLNTR